MQLFPPANEGLLYELLDWKRVPCGMYDSPRINALPSIIADTTPITIFREYLGIVDYNIFAVELFVSTELTLRSNY